MKMFYNLGARAQGYEYFSCTTHIKFVIFIHFLIHLFKQLFLGPQKNCVIDTLLWSTHSICLGRKIRFFFYYAHLFRGMFINNNLW